LFEAPLGLAWREVPDVVEDQRHERGGALAPAWPGDVDLADASHAVLLEVGPDRFLRFPPARELRQLVQEGLVLATLVRDVLQEPHDVRMRANHVRDVQQRQPHLRRDVAGGGQRERVGRVLLAHPRLQLLVEPPRGLHPRHDRPMAQRIAEDSLVVLEGLQQKVEQLWPGLRLDVALPGGDRGPVALDQLGDDRRIGVDLSGRAPDQRPGVGGVRGPDLGARGGSRRVRGWSAARPRSADRLSP